MKKEIGYFLTTILFIAWIAVIATGFRSETYIAHLQGDSMIPVSYPNNIGFCVEKENYK